MASVKGAVNAKGLKEFQKNLEKLNEVERRQWNEAAVKGLAARLLAKVKKRTPVGIYSKRTGKKGGTLRRNWTVGKVNKSGDTYTIEIKNPVHYAPYVEFGHRTANHQGWVDGKFMLTISEQELQKDAPRILMNKLKSFIGGALS